MMKQYLRGNITENSITTVKYFLKTLSSLCETIIFMYLGVSTLCSSYDSHWDWVFIVSSIFFCLLFRAIGVFFLTFIANRFRVARFSWVDQIIMAYGGLRGAIAFGLVASLDHEDIPAKKMYFAATVAIILFTVFIQV